MPIVVNGRELSDADIAQELPAHRDAPDPVRMAALTVILRQLVREEAGRLGLGSAAAADDKDDDDDALAQALLAREVSFPAPDEDSCRRHYAQHPQAFLQGAWVDARHILFQVMPGAPLPALRSLARQTLEALQAAPARFSELARERSNCPSGVNGGALGRLHPGDTVPEFDAALFSAASTGLLPQVLETRHGLHVVQITARHAGQRLPFEAVHGSIARALAAAAQDRAWKQYASLLIGRARIEGIDLNGAQSPLLQ
jgi:peptidyl-prolyl cis-trans isomerase C